MPLYLTIMEGPTPAQAEVIAASKDEALIRACSVLLSRRLDVFRSTAEALEQLEQSLAAERAKNPGPRR